MPAERIPPHNLDAERAVLGCLLLEGARSVEALDLPVEAFYLNAHRDLYATMRTLAEQTGVVDPLTVRAELARVGLLEAVGGPGHLALCEQEASIAVHLPRYAALVREQAARREAIQACAQAIGALYGANGAGETRPVAEVAEELQQRLVVLAGQADHAARAVPILEVVDEVRAYLDAPAGQRQMVRTPIPELNQRLGGGTLAGELVLVGGRPGTAKTALALQWAALAAQDGHRTLVISREMRTLALGRRFVAQQLRIPAGSLRKADLWPEERTRLEQARARLGAVPLWFADQAVTIGHIRRLTRLLAPRLLIVDYIQLVESPADARAGKRLEVTAVSRALKRLATQGAGCSVVALSSLRRLGPDGGKGGKKMPPTLDDLKECVVHDSLVTMADGTRRPIALLRPGERIQAWDDQTGRFGPASLRAVWNRGRQPVLTVETSNGRVLRTTESHPFRTPSGWVSADQLTPGTLLAVPRVLEHRHTVTSLPFGLARFLGYMVGDGFCQRHRGVGFINNDGAMLSDVHAIVAEHFPEVTIRRREQHGSTEFWFTRRFSNGYGRPGGNPLRNWLFEVGLGGHRDYTKRVPGCIMGADAATARHFLAGLLATDGTIAKHATGYEVKIASSSRGLMDDLQALLTHLGITSAIDRGYTSTKATRPVYNLRVARQSIAALRSLPLVGRKAARLAALRETTMLSAGLERLPAQATAALRSYCLERSLSCRRVFGYKPQGTKRMSRLTARRLVNLGVEPLRWWADSEVVWDPVRIVMASGAEEVWDLQVDGPPTFVANGFTVHNSGDLEADADVVILLWQKGDDGRDRECSFAKVRDGAAGGSTTLDWDPRYVQFSQIAPGTPEARADREPGDETTPF